MVSFSSLMSLHAFAGSFSYDNEDIPIDDVDDKEELEEEDDA